MQAAIGYLRVRATARMRRSALCDEFVLALQLGEGSVQFRQLLLHVMELFCL